MKILMVGLGAIGQRHLRNLVALLGSEAEFIAFRSRGLNNVLTDQMKIEPDVDLITKYHLQPFNDLDEALSQKPAIAFICNPSSLHISAALKAAQAGCHLFLEKPLSHNLEGIGELEEIVHQKRLVAYVGYQLRFHPCLGKLRNLLNQKAIGRILAARVEIGEYLPAWHPYEDYRKSYAARQDLGGGTLLSQIHEFDYLYWLFGLPRRIFTLGGHLSSLDVDVEDVTSTLMEFDCDGTHFPVHLHQDFIQRPPSRTCEVIGDAGKVFVDFLALKVCLYDGQGQLVEQAAFPEFQRNQLFLDELAHFLDCLRNRSQPLVTLNDGVQSLRIALAAKDSLTSGKVVEL